MTYLIHLSGIVEGAQDYPELTEHVGRYLVAYDPWLAYSGEQWLWTTDDEDRALGFRDMQQAHQLWTTSIGTRPDGKPDRPLTIYHVQILQKGQEPILGEHST